MTDAENMEYLFFSEMEDRRRMALMQQARSGYWDEIFRPLDEGTFIWPIAAHDDTTSPDVGSD